MGGILEIWMVRVRDRLDKQGTWSVTGGGP